MEKKKKKITHISHMEKVSTLLHLSHIKKIQKIRISCSRLGASDKNLLRKCRWNLFLLLSEKKGLDAYESGKLFEMYHSTVSKVIYKWHRFQTTANLSRTGQPNKFSPRKRTTRKKEKDVSKNPKISSHNASTIGMRLHEFDLHGRSARNKPLPSKKNIRERLHFLNEHLGSKKHPQTSCNWKNIAFGSGKEIPASRCQRLVNNYAKCLQEVISPKSYWSLCTVATEAKDVLKQTNKKKHLLIFLLNKFLKKWIFPVVLFKHINFYICQLKGTDSKTFVCPKHVKKNSTISMGCTYFFTWL